MLTLSTLTLGLTQVFNSNPSSAYNAANAISNAYADYLISAQFGLGSVLDYDLQITALTSVLLGGFNSMSAAGAALAFSTGITAFWIGVPIVGVQSGATIGCPGAAALSATLTALFLSFPATTQIVASSMSSLIHTATTTTTALVTNIVPIPPTIIVPIS